MPHTALPHSTLHCPIPLHSTRTFLFPCVVDIDDNELYDSDYGRMMTDSDDYQAYFLSKVYQGAMMPRWANGKRHDTYSGENNKLSNECCKKSCSYPEMLGYCNGEGGFNSWDDVNGA